MKIIGVIAIALLSVTLITNCKKEVSNPSSSPSGFNYKVKSNIDYSKISVKQSSSRTSSIGGILHFADMATFLAVEADLEQQVEELDDAFVDVYNYLNDEDINLMQEDLNFDEFQPLYDFEENFPNFNSIRAKIAEETMIYDEIEDQDPNSDPEDSFIIFSDVTRTLINESGDIAIGNKIYRINNDGSHWEINSLDVTLLETLPDHTTVQGEQYTTGIKILIRKSSSNTDCKKNKWNGELWKYNTSGNKKHKWKIGVFNYPFHGGSRMKIINKKKKKKRRKTVWRRYRTETTLSMCGNGCNNKNNGAIVQGAECSPTGTLYWPAGSPSYKKKRSVDRKLQEFNWTKTNFITGTFIGAGGVNTRVLTF
tara:strand:+ start:4668 stop:5768 length:1101 start_codon:yes stop_codon:yes gene_type:complete